MPISFYNLALFVHISSVVFWLSTIPIAYVIDRVVTSLSDKERQFSTMSLISVNSKIFIVSAVLVVITGSIMVEVGKWGWAPGPGLNWLIVKQGIWLTLLISGFLLMRPAETKLAELIQEDAPFENAYNLFKLIKRRGHMLSGLIVLNIFLATNKPF